MPQPLGSVTSAPTSPSVPASVSVTTATTSSLVNPPLPPPASSVPHSGSAVPDAPHLNPQAVKRAALIETQVGWHIDEIFRNNHVQFITWTPEQILSNVVSDSLVAAYIEGRPPDHVELIKLHVRMRIGQFEPASVERDILALSQAVHVRAMAQAASHPGLVEWTNTQIRYQRPAPQAGNELEALQFSDAVASMRRRHAEQVGLSVAIALLRQVTPGPLCDVSLQNQLESCSDNELPVALRNIAVATAAQLPDDLLAKARIVKKFFDDLPLAEATQLVQEQERARAFGGAVAAPPGTSALLVARTWVAAQVRVCVDTMARLRIILGLVTQAREPIPAGPSIALTPEQRMPRQARIHIDTVIGSFLSDELASREAMLVSEGPANVLVDIKNKNNPIRTFYSEVNEGRNHAGFPRGMDAAAIRAELDKYIKTAVYLHQSIGLERDIATLARLIEMDNNLGPAVAIALFRDIASPWFKMDKFLAGRAPSGQVVATINVIRDFYAYCRLRYDESFALADGDDVDLLRLEASEIWINAQVEVCLNVLSDLHPDNLPRALGLSFVDIPAGVQTEVRAPRPAVSQVAAPVVVVGPPQAAPEPALNLYDVIISGDTATKLTMMPVFVAAEPDVALPTLVELMDDGDEAVRALARSLLVEHGQRRTCVLLALQQEQYPEAQQEALLAAEPLCNDAEIRSAAQTLLIGWMRHVRPEKRLVAVRHLYTFFPLTQAQRLLIATTRDADPNVADVAREQLAARLGN